MQKFIYKYNIISPKTGIEESFTGLFSSKKESDKWFSIHGKFFKETIGARLILRGREATGRYTYNAVKGVTKEGERVIENYLKDKNIVNN